MNTAWVLASLVAGVLLGVLYFGGLWLTVRRLPTAHSPAMLLLASFLVRTALVVSGIYLMMNGRWEPASACLGGFLLARTMICGRLRPRDRGPHGTALSVDAGRPTS